MKTLRYMVAREHANPDRLTAALTPLDCLGIAKLSHDEVEWSAVRATDTADAIAKAGAHGWHGSDRTASHFLRMAEAGR